jgi:hypothetical protein
MMRLSSCECSCEVKRVQAQLSVPCVSAVQQCLLGSVRVQNLWQMASDVLMTSQLLMPHSTWSNEHANNFPYLMRLPSHVAHARLQGPEGLLVLLHQQRRRLPRNGPQKRWHAPVRLLRLMRIRRCRGASGSGRLFCLLHQKYVSV